MANLKKLSTKDAEDGVMNEVESDSDDSDISMNGHEMNGLQSKWNDSDSE